MLSLLFSLFNNVNYCRGKERISIDLATLDITKDLYLASSESRDIEVFSLKAVSFRVFSIPFPAISNSSTSFIIGDLLTIITCYGELAELDLGAGSSFRTSTLAVFSAFTGDLATFDLETKTLTEASIE